MLNIEELEIKIYPLILESKETASSLWHIIRALDKKGSGKVSLTMKELKDILKVSSSSIYRFEPPIGRAEGFFFQQYLANRN